MSERANATAQLSRRRRLLVLGICSMSLLIVGLDTTIVNVALLRPRHVGLRSGSRDRP